MRPKHRDGHRPPDRASSTARRTGVWLAALVFGKPGRDLTIDHGYRAARMTGIAVEIQMVVEVE